MAHLNQLLSDHGYEVNSLTAEQISECIHSGAGTDSLLVAMEAWHRLSEQLAELSHQHEAIWELPATQWSGLAAQRMTLAFNRYAIWLRRTASKALGISCVCRWMAEEYEDAHSHVATPAVLENNRVTAQRLRTENIAEVHTPEIENLDEQYRFFASTNARAIRDYTRQAAMMASRLSSFAEPPEPEPAIPELGVNVAASDLSSTQPPLSEEEIASHEQPPEPPKKRKCVLL